MPGARRKAGAIGKKKGGDFRSTLATGAAVQAEEDVAFRKREEQRKKEAAGLVNGGAKSFEDQARDRAQALVDEQYKKDQENRRNERVNQGGVGSANARFKFGDLASRQKRTKKVRYRQI